MTPIAPTPLHNFHDACLADGGEMGALMRALDWAQSELGPVQAWPQSLRTAVSICLNSRFPMLIWWGADLIMLYNDAYRPILGTTKHPQALGQRGQACWPEIWPIIGPMLTAVLSRGEATWSNDQLLVLDRNGYLEECYFTFSYSPIREEEGQVGGVFTAVTETTAQVVSARRLRTLRELAARIVAAQTVEAACALAMETLADNRADLPFALLYLLDESGQHLRLVGTTGLEVGQPASPALLDLKEATARTAWPFRQVMTHSQAHLVTDLPARFGALPGGPWLAPPTTALLLPIPSATQERPTGLLVAGISPRRALDPEYRSFLELVAGQVATAVADARAYEAERRRAEALAELDRAKNTFFSNISHEFRTPLTLMVGPLDALLQQPQALADPARVQLEMVYGNGLRLLKLVNTLLDFSQLQEGRLQAHYEPVDLAAYTAELAGVFRSVMEHAGLRLHVVCPPLPQPIYVDREMWEKIVLNLLSNAFKFTLVGTVTVTLTWHGDQVVLTVADTGSGIPAAELPHIFSRFHRVRGGVARTQEGSGIGLALVQELSKLHGGTAQVASTEGEGATFTITIPTGVAHLPANRIGGASRPSPAPLAEPYLEEAQRWRTAQQESAQSTGLAAYATRVVEPTAHRLPHTPLILIADDNRDMRTYLQRLLEPRYRVEAAADGAAALAAIHAHKPNLVLSDVMMPKLDGFALLQAIRRDPELRETPVILLSARAGEESRVEGLKAGADDYLVKPFSARELLARIEAHFALQRLRKDAFSALRQSEEHFRVVSGLTSDYAYALQLAPNGDVKIEWIFGSFEQITGYSPETDEVCNDWRALIHAADLPLIQQRIEHLRAGQADTCEFRICTKSGEVRWLRDYAQPQIDAAERVVRIIGAAREITAQKETAAALQESKAQLQRVIDGSNDGFWDWNVQSGAIYVSPRWYAILGYAPNEFALDQPMLERLVHPADLASVQQTVAAVIDGRTGKDRYTLRHRYVGKDGVVYWVLARGSITQRDDQGRALLLSGTITDITARKAAEDALRESEARFRHMADNAPTMIWVTDATGSCIFLNQPWYAFTGQSTATGLGLGWLVAVHPADRAKAETSFLQANANQSTFKIEYRLQRHDGEYRWAIDTAVPRFGEDQTFLGYIGSVTDIHERKEAEEAVQHSEQHLRDVIDGLAAFICVLTPAGTLLKANRPGLQAAGLHTEEVVGRSFLEAYWWSYHGDVQARLRTAIARAATGDYVRYDETMRLANDQYIAVDLMLSPIVKEGCVTYVVASAIDITERKLAEQALRESESQLRALAETLEQRVTERTAELERSNQELDQFAYIASHDLKTPLRGINNLAKWIAEDAGEVLPEPSTEHLDKLRGRVQRMERLLDDLLAYSRIGRREDQSEVVETEKLIRDVVYLLAPPEGFVVHVAPRLPTLITPQAPLALVFRNLIGNALKHHTQPHTGEVWVSAQLLDDFVEFSVRDNGPGIDPQHHERIFGMFQVLRSRDEVEGSGMGLAIVRKTVEYRKGKIYVKSALGEGTMFRFTWPKAT